MKKVYKWTYLQNKIIDVESNLMFTWGKAGRDELEAWRV